MSKGRVFTVPPARIASREIEASASITAPSTHRKTPASNSAAVASSNGSSGGRVT